MYNLTRTTSILLARGTILLSSKDTGNKSGG